MDLRLTALLIAGILAGALPKSARAQNCGCSANTCCSQYGYCGTGSEYCGDGCQAGPCHSPPPSNGSDGGGGVSIAKIVTEEFFNGILNQADKTCAGKDFYTRSAFLDALKSYPEFGQGGSEDDAKREVAAFFAHTSRETGGYCYIEEPDGALREYCDKSSTKYPCATGKRYYGRGPFQLQWNFNYGAAGESIGVDSLNDPEIVSTDPIVSFKTALWFWMNNAHSVVSQGFGATIRALYVGECNGGNNNAVSARFSYFRDYCNQLGVSYQPYQEIHIF